MAREIDETFIEEAIERYQRLDALQAEFAAAVSRAEVTVASPDGLVEVVVSADGSIRDVTITGSLVGRSNGEVSRSLREAITAAASAAAWARAKLHGETFGGYPELATRASQDQPAPVRRVHGTR